MIQRVTTALDLAAQIRSGAVSATEAVEAALEAIDRRDGEIGAFVTLCRERALAEAARIEPGDPRPLCGVPFGVKDLFAPTEGVRTTHGSAGFGDWVATRDAPHVARLRRAGAILVGKTNTPELGLRPVTEPTRHGPTRNPRDPRLTAGGSSGGSAAAVAAGFVPLCDGSDLGGSIRIPAACCGVVGVKPSRGLVPNGPDLDATGASAHGTFGPIARTVSDAAAALGVMAATDRLAGARAPERLRVRVALTAPLGVPVEPEPRAAAERAAALLADLGHDVREDPPDWDDDRFPHAWMTAAAYGMREIVAMLERAHGRAVDPAGLEPETRAWLIDGPAVPAAAAGAAMETLSSYSERVLRGWSQDEVLLTPTLTRLPAALHELRSQAGVSTDGVRFSAFARVSNVTGQPALTLPAGDSAVQIAALPGRDDLVLGVAAQLERALR